VVKMRLNDDWHARFALMQFYNQNNLNNFYESQIKTIEASHNSQTIRNSDFYLKQYLFDLEISNFESYKNDNGLGDLHFQATNNALDIFYICTKFEQICLMLNRARTTRFEYDYTMVKDFVKAVEQSDYLKNPTVALWYAGWQLLNEPTAKHHKNLQKRLQTETTCVPKQEMRNLYTYLENTVKQVYPTDRDAYFSTLFELYKTQLEFKIIYNDEGYLPPQIFYNIFAVAMTQADLAWADDFLNANRNKIIADYTATDDIYSLCRAIWQFEHRGFEAALDTLNTTNLDNIYSKIIERRLRLKIYFEMKEWNLMESLVNSFRKFLTDSKAKLPETQLQPQRDFLTALLALYKISDGLLTANTKTQFATVENLLTTQPMLPERNWITYILSQQKK
jgi:hypothetical protein